ncbi:MULTISPECIES: DUF3180 domain-containing protein [Dermacoccus]|uniref:DUF3180 domain-containing protein n=3 Tax=Dermacoccus TaxID=57495 RepID=A0A417YWN9_9MICO|nr:DUF3180 domain-containing protein [Dermacoccus abyssi]RHW41939.1 DUF3180 domain-containing protein [Dermacoccus abyssi]
MKPLAPRSALIAGVVVTAVTALAMQLVRNGGNALPQHSWWEMLLVVALSGAHVAGGWLVRDQVRTRTKAKREADARLRAGQDEALARSAAAGVMQGHEGPSADTARRVVVFSQAAAIGGAVLTGWYAGQAVVQFGRLHIASVRSGVILLGALVVASVVLSVLGFVVQKWCTIPDDER